MKTQKIVKVDYESRFDILYLRLEGYEKKSPAWDEEGIEGLIVGRDLVDDSLAGFNIEGFKSHKAEIARNLEKNSYPLGMGYDVPEAGLRDVPLKDVLDWAYQKYAEEISEEDIISEMLEQDFIVRMSPVKEYIVRARIKSVKKATPRIVELEGF